MSNDFHGRIMNILPRRTEDGQPIGWSPAYLEGHRDARHAAAEIAMEADRRIEDLTQTLGEVSERRMIACTDLAGLRGVSQRLADVLRLIAAMEDTETDEWDAVDRLIPAMCNMARAALAEWEWHRYPHTGGGVI